jgi:predicted nucleic acid-binding protein
VSKRLILFDTSVYIGVIRREIEWEVIAAPTRVGRVRLSSVVGFELLVGARSADDARDLKGMIQQFEQAGWTLTPRLQDWTLAGEMIARYSRIHGRLHARDHLPDILLVLCAAQVGGEIVTTNVRDLQRWASAARKSGINAQVTSVSGT